MLLTLKRQSSTFKFSCVFLDIYISRLNAAARCSHMYEIFPHRNYINAQCRVCLPLAKLYQLITIYTALVNKDTGISTLARMEL